LILGSRTIDIPAGEPSYIVRDRYVLPVDVEALGIYPHAHYVGREMKVWAELPDGERRWLIHIPDWDFNWQDEYRYTSGVTLPRGSRIEIEFDYDNSAENVRNPNEPPRRVLYGANSTDEMAEVMIQVLPADEAKRATLEADFERFRVDKAIVYRRKRLEDNPQDTASHSALASSYLYLGQPELAIPHLETALRIGPESAGLHQNLGYALRQAGRRDDSIRHYQRALALDPLSSETAFDLAQVLRETGERVRALSLFREVARMRPEFAGPFAAIAGILIEDPTLSDDGRAQAVAMAERAARLSRRQDRRILETLAAAYEANGQPDRAKRTRQATTERNNPN
jgi:tetratricopeptide (TPR) repeat protein